MKQWDTYPWVFPHGSHPCIVISPPARVTNPDCETVNLLACSTQRASRQALAHEVLLDEADGVDWETLVRCDVIWLANKSELKRHRGSVTPERRRAIGKKIVRLFGFWLD